MDFDTADLIGTVEAARILDVSRRNLLRMPLEPALKMPGATGATLYLRADVLALRAERDGAAEGAA